MLNVIDEAANSKTVTLKKLICKLVYEAITGRVRAKSYLWVDVKQPRYKAGRVPKEVGMSFVPYEPSRLLKSFFIAGFQYWDGASVLGELNVGDKLALVAEPDNPHDSQAVAIRFKGVKLGYVPAEENAMLSTLIYFGHEKAFETVVQQVSLDRSPWHQVRVGVFVVDAR